MKIKPLYKAAECADGFRVSIQGNSTAYCSPRNDCGPYTEVELGFPSVADEILLPYAENRNDPTETVYPYVPSAIVLEVLLAHGGWVDGEIPPMVLDSNGK